jgi:hypothetical protein
MRNISIRKGEDGDEQIVNEVLESSLSREKTSKVDLRNVNKRVLIRVDCAARVGLRQMVRSETAAAPGAPPVLGLLLKCVE